MNLYEVVLFCLFIQNSTVVTRKRFGTEPEMCKLVGTLASLLKLKVLENRIMHLFFIIISTFEPNKTRALSELVRKSHLKYIFFYLFLKVHGLKG